MRNYLSIKRKDFSSSIILFAKYSGQIPVKREDKESRNRAYKPSYSIFHSYFYTWGTYFSITFIK